MFYVATSAHTDAPTLPTALLGPTLHAAIRAEVDQWRVCVDAAALVSRSDGTLAIRSRTKLLNSDDDDSLFGVAHVVMERDGDAGYRLFVELAPEYFPTEGFPRTVEADSSLPVTQLRLTYSDEPLAA